jgi:hypothetical protein
MNPWRKRRRQKLRRQNEGFCAYLEWLSVADIATVTFEPLTSITSLITVNPENAFMHQFDTESDAELNAARDFFSKPMPRLFIAHDPSEFFGMDPDTGVITP